MGWPFVSRSRYDAVYADRERVRGERDQFLKDRKAAQASARTAARQYDEAGAVIACLEKKLAGQDQPATAAPDDARTAALEAEVADLRKRLARAQAETVALSGELAEVRETRRQIDGGSNRPRTEAVELRLAREQARALADRISELQTSHVADTRELHDLRQNGAAS